MEPDHTGSLAQLKEKNKKLVIICSKKAIELVREFYGIEEGVRAVSSGDTLDLGTPFSISRKPQTYIGRKP
jgi:flavorubredoxin